MSPPTISLRAGFRWTDKAGQPLIEDTSTLVLTTSTSRFVDIRVHHHTPLPDDRGLPHDAGALGLLNWAFAGTASSHKVTDSGPPYDVCRWTHWVDSRVVLGGEPHDDFANMYNMQNGLALEIGSMRHPSGEMFPYEELWTDLAIESTNLVEPRRKVCILATMEDSAREAQSMIVRVGRWVQGIVAKGGEISVERWKWREESGKFERVVKIGRLFLPCFIGFDEGSTTQVGKTLEFDKLVWKVDEKLEWTD
ncbi:MAG: hypothetical protein M1821_001159 [Bathelium mastoideum]|nr:MAG: hypothetical protein M1821_001159 [Bathelium mastoideum]